MKATRALHSLAGVPGRALVVGRLAARGVGSQFGSPLTYVAVATFYLILGWLFRSYIIAARTNDLSSWFDQIEFLLVLVVPVFTMRAIADELRTGSIDLLWVRGMRPFEVVVAKFAGSACFVLTVLALPLFAVGVTIASVTRLDAGTYLAQTVGAACLALLLVALGTATSALSGNPLVAAVIASTIGVLLWFLDLANLPAAWLQRLFALRLHLAGFQVGEVRLDDLIALALLGSGWAVVATAALRIQRVLGGDS
jgi:ABC-2 type transport system permease protein